jgi:hypothetical protein
MLAHSIPFSKELLVSGTAKGMDGNSGIGCGALRTRRVSPAAATAGFIRSSAH